MHERGKDFVEAYVFFVFSGDKKWEKFARNGLKYANFCEINVVRCAIW